MKNAVILCAGLGTKVWPYAQIRCKAMIPVSNKPIISFTVDYLCELKFEKIVIVANKFSEEIVNYFRDYNNVEIILDTAPKGTAFSLLKAQELIGANDFLTFFGDTYLPKNEIVKLIEAFGNNNTATALVGNIRDRCGDYIGCILKDGLVHKIWGHSRDESSHHFGAFAFNAQIFEELKYNGGRFKDLDVGNMPHIEGYIEMTLSDIIGRGGKVFAVESEAPIFDIDKPWHILEANHYINKERCSALTQNELAEGASIDETATINGYVKLGKNSKIGKNVIIGGNIIVGDNTKIYNGAIVEGNVVIGNDTSIRNVCFIEEGSTIGDDCIVSHAAEMDGIMMKRVYLYHYMELCGIIGENTDLGAATVCGSLRFDDGITLQRVKGRREFPMYGGDATFLGDYCRTGVNAILMPGVKIGVYSIVGPGVLLSKDLADNTFIYTEQTLTEKRWGSERYGW